MTKKARSRESPMRTYTQVLACDKRERHHDMYTRRQTEDAQQTARGTTRHDTTRHGTARHGTARHGTARHDTARHGTTRHDTTRHDTAQYVDHGNGDSDHAPDATRHADHAPTRHAPTRPDTPQHANNDDGRRTADGGRWKLASSRQQSQGQGIQHTYPGNYHS